MDLIVPAPSTHPVTQVGHDVMLTMYNTMNFNSSLMYVQIMTQKKLALFFPLQVKNKPHDKVKFMRLFLNRVQLLTYKLGIKKV
jgi:hypothetical protein